jgi:hypothetical protein
LRQNRAKTGGASCGPRRRQGRNFHDGCGLSRRQLREHDKPTVREFQRVIVGIHIARQVPKPCRFVLDAKPLSAKTVVVVNVFIESQLCPGTKVDGDPGLSDETETTTSRFRTGFRNQFVSNSGVPLNGICAFGCFALRCCGHIRKPPSISGIPMS